MKLSVVIPTYKRPASLLRLLHSIQAQFTKPDEIIIVNGAGNEGFPSDEIADLFSSLYQTSSLPPTSSLPLSSLPLSSLPLTILHTDASVCLQRNTGIKAAQGEYVFLCDDDIELPENYISALLTFFEENPSEPIATGLVMEKVAGEFVSTFPSASAWSILYKRLFFHSVWEHLEERKGFLFKGLKRYYKTRGNTCTPSGLPLLTDFSGEVIKTKFYGLGASIVKKEWLLNNLFDEVLDRSGIGDNYSIALGLDIQEAINVVKYTKAWHHKEESNRLVTAVSYKRRLLALDYFLRTKGKMEGRNFPLIWTVTGNLLSAVLHLNGSLVKANLSLIGILFRKKNPYRDANRAGERFCSP